MVNFQFNLASVSGIILAVGGAALYAIRSARPEISRDHDIFFSAVGLLCGLILIFYGWRFDPIMQFGQVLLTGASIFFVVENLRLRKVSTQQAKERTPIVDRERPVSREYQAVLDDYEAIDERVRRPQIRGSRDARSTRDEYRDEYDDRSSRRSTPRNRDERLNPSGGGTRRPRRRDEEVASSDAVIDSTAQETWGGSGRSRNGGSRPGSSTSGSRPRRPRASESDRASSDFSPADYVEYRPVDKDETDNWGES